MPVIIVRSRRADSSKNNGRQNTDLGESNTLHAYLQTSASSYMVVNHHLDWTGFSSSCRHTKDTSLVMAMSYVGKVRIVSDSQKVRSARAGICRVQGAPTAERLLVLSSCISA